MYTDNDLDRAVELGIFSSESVAKFKQHHAKGQEPNAADEENVRLLVSFNDVFVVMAIGLLLFSLNWMIQPINAVAAAVAIASVSWILAEFFVRKRNMALPAIVLLVTYVGGLCGAVLMAYDHATEYTFVWVGLVAMVGTWLHWKRFNVPITLAAGALALVVFMISLLMSLLPSAVEYLAYIMFACGVAVFSLAMYWDGADVQRVTRKSDVAFWLHLAAAPLIVHPVFLSLGITNGFEQGTTMMAMMGLYLVLTMVSLVLDRRAFMVSALIYVVVALTQFFESSGFVGDSLAYVGALMGLSLLLLSGFWHKARKPLVMHLPNAIQHRVPSAR